ncbi:MAG TPA: DUF502 domain-containing protein [Candidatus Bathyarchaeia archaeon]|nr:DUF502 domain-containing protein [Candidatus Bathyarchaeia archaeon]
MMFFKKIISRLTHSLWLLFLNGLMPILPLTLTLVFFNTFFRIIVGWLEPLRAFASHTLLSKVPFVEVIICIAFIFFIGIMYNTFILKPLMHLIESLIFKLPLVNPVYSGIKQLISAFSIQDKLTFKKVILTEFPRKNMYSLGFLTSEIPPELAPDKQKKYFTVFIPTTPNPTTGFCIILTEEEITVVDLNRQEAMAIIISGGIIQPERFMRK